MSHTDYPDPPPLHTYLNFFSFRFPLDELRRLKWIDFVRKQRKEDDWLPNNSSKICSIHFNNDDKYKSSKGLILLKKSALPVLETPHSSPPAISCFENLFEAKLCVSKECNCSKMSAAPVLEVSQYSQPAPGCSNNLSEEESSKLDSSSILNNSAFPVLEVCPCSQPAPTSPDSLDKESISDMESIFESPQITALKKCIKKLYLQKQKLVNKNRNLTKRNKRLETKVASMSTMLKHLKKKAYISDVHFSRN